MVLRIVNHTRPMNFMIASGWTISWIVSMNSDVNTTNSYYSWSYILMLKLLFWLVLEFKEVILTHISNSIEFSHGDKWNCEVLYQHHFLAHVLRKITISMNHNRRKLVTMNHGGRKLLVTMKHSGRKINLLHHKP